MLLLLRLLRISAMRERFGERGHVFWVVADGCAGAAVGVVAVRMVQRADAVRLLLRGCGVWGGDAGPSFWT